MNKIITLLFTAFLFISLTGCEDVVNYLLSDDESSDTSDLGSNTLRNDIIATARQQLGVQYVYGGETPAGFDCSGLCKYCYGQNGITLVHSSSIIYSNGTKVGLSEAKVADIVCFYSPVSHVGMIIDSTTFIHAPNSTTVVQESELTGYWGEHLKDVVSYID